MFYHVVVTHKQPRNLQHFELDVNEEWVGRQIVGPYARGTGIAIGGRTVPPDDIDNVQVFETEHEGRRVYSDTPPRQPLEGRRRDEYIIGLARNVTRDFITMAQGSMAPGSIHPPGDPSKVFIVHGRDMRSRDAMFSFLRAIGLHPLEWSQARERTGKPTPYVGEILDAGFSMASAAVVLMTPDDEARLRPEFVKPDDEPSEKALRGQPRQNVIYEAGMAMARFPDRTVLVRVGQLRSFSDIEGRHVVRFGGEPSQRKELAQRLRDAQCAVNLVGDEWLTMALDLGQSATASPGAGAKQ